MEKEKSLKILDECIEKLNNLSEDEEVKLREDAKLFERKYDEYNYKGEADNND